jgi:SpoVK/Ycf46/Vps4 family AAA+-type ATPase
LFCGLPGCGKTLRAEVCASEPGPLLYIVKLDRLISSYLREAASNVRKIFDSAHKHPYVLFLDEFDALARSRADTPEDSRVAKLADGQLWRCCRRPGCRRHGLRWLTAVWLGYSWRTR